MMETRNTMEITAEHPQIHTKYGIATFYDRYYRITSTKEGNNNKLLHRLIFEDYHNCTLDKKDSIHHIDYDTTNNHPTNLICMSKPAHHRLHSTKSIEYRVIKHGFDDNGKQRYGISYKNTFLKTSPSKQYLNVLLKYCNEKNDYTILHKINGYHITKYGKTNNGKQRYCLRHYSKVIKISQFLNKLENKMKQLIGDE